MKRKTLFAALAFAVAAAIVAIGCAGAPARAVGVPVDSRTVTPMRPGVYVHTVTGFYPGIEVEVTLSERRIENVRILSHGETEGIARPAFAYIPAEIVRYQSTMVDRVAGATLTSFAIRHAVELAITEAGGNVAEYQVVMPPRVVFGTDRGPDRLPRRWHETYDIVVVGGGFAGLAAAHAAASNGASVILVEKMPFLGGNSIINGGVYAAYTSRIAADIQARHGIPPDSAAQHIEDIIVGGDFMAVEFLVRQFVTGSPFMLNMFLDNGLRVRDGITRTGGHFGHRTYTTYSGQGSCIVEVQERMAIDAGVRIELNTKMVRIHREDRLSGNVVGIAVQTNDGLRHIRANRAVVMTTGGFGANVALRSRHVPYLDATIATTNHVGATGEAISWVQEIGADTMHMNIIQLYPFAEPNAGILDLWAVIPFTGPGAGIVYVDTEGRRFVNEGDRRDVVQRAMFTSGGFPTFAIFGNDIVQNGGFTNQDDIDAGIRVGRVLTSNTLEGLALEINRQTFRLGEVNMNPATLAATITAHNSFVVNRHDPEFGKVIDPYLTRIIDPPFFAIAQWPSVHYTGGGLVVNERLQVIDIFGQVIPGIYAAGEIIGGTHGNNRLGSNAVAAAVTHGFMIGYYTATGNLAPFLR